MLGDKPLGCLLAPGLLDEAFDAFGRSVAELNLQPEEASSGVQARHGLTGGGLGGCHLVRLLLADADHCRGLLFAHAEEGPTPDLEHRYMKEETALPSRLRSLR